jgi:hypothetical protein
MLSQLAEARTSATGDLFLGLGYVQDSLQSIRDGTNVKAGGSPFVELFGTMAEFERFGFGIDISGRPARN